MECLEEHLESVIRAHEAVIKPYTIRYFGEEYVIFPNVFSPILTASTTTTIRSMIKRVQDFERKKIVDMGCGCGVLAIEALKLGASHGLAVDITTAAVENTLENIKRLGLVNHTDVVKSDLFSRVPENGMFDVVLANLPLVDRKSENELEKAFFDKGYRTTKKFLNSVGDWLAPDGKVFFNCASIADSPRIVNWATGSHLFLEEVDLFDDYVFDHYVFVFRKS